MYNWIALVKCHKHRSSWLEKAGQIRLRHSTLGYSLAWSLSFKVDYLRRPGEYSYRCNATLNIANYPPEPNWFPPQSAWFAFAAEIKINSWVSPVSSTAYSFPCPTHTLRVPNVLFDGHVLVSLTTVPFVIISSAREPLLRQTGINATTQDGETYTARIIQ
jgi:hypothetical protein